MIIAKTISATPVNSSAGIALRRLHVAFHRADDQRQPDAHRKRHAHSGRVDAHHQEDVREVKKHPADQRRQTNPQAAECMFSLAGAPAGPKLPSVWANTRLNRNTPIA